MAKKLTSTYSDVKGLNRALRKLPKEAAEKLRGASLDIAEFVAADARGRAVRVGGVARHVAPTIRAARDRVPVVKMGSSAPLPSTSRSRRGSRQTVGDVIFGAEYGGNREDTGVRFGHTIQFNPWRGNKGAAGYFLWPSIRTHSDDIHERYSQALLDALRAI